MHPNIAQTHLPPPLHHLSTTSPNPSLLAQAVKSLPDVTHQELKVRGKSILLLM